jgi:hypothetical protein
VDAVPHLRHGQRGLAVTPEVTAKGGGGGSGGGGEGRRGQGRGGEGEGRGWSMVVVSETRV